MRATSGIQARVKTREVTKTAGRPASSNTVDPKTGQIVSPEVLDRLFEGAVGEPGGG